MGSSTSKNNREVKTPVAITVTPKVEVPVMVIPQPDPYEGMAICKLSHYRAYSDTDPKHEIIRYNKVDTIFCSYEKEIDEFISHWKGLATDMSLTDENQIKAIARYNRFIELEKVLECKEILSKYIPQFIFIMKHINLGTWSNPGDGFAFRFSDKELYEISKMFGDISMKECSEIYYGCLHEVKQDNLDMRINGDWESRYYCLRFNSTLLYRVNQHLAQKAAIQLLRDENILDRDTTSIITSYI
jgi:hypothetical protein